jgi:hypothetical protein
MLVPQSISDSPNKKTKTKNKKKISLSMYILKTNDREPRSSFLSVNVYVEARIVCNTKVVEKQGEKREEEARIGFMRDK